jgi:hypothetical protein
MVLLCVQTNLRRSAGGQEIGGSGYGRSHEEKPPTNENYQAHG